MEQTKKQKGVFIPLGILEDKNLTTTEKVIYSIYTYYTENGKGCYYSAPALAEKLGITDKTVKRSRAHLKELGMVEVVRRGKYYVTRSVSGKNVPTNRDVETSENQDNTKPNEIVCDTHNREATTDTVSGKNVPTNRDVETIGTQEVEIMEHKEIGNVNKRVKMSRQEGQNVPTVEGQNVPILNKECINKEKDNIIYSSSTSACGNGFAPNFRNTIETCLDRKEQVPSLIRKDARKWVWGKWNRFQESNSCMSVAECLKWFKSFKSWFIVVCDSKERYTEVLRTISGQFAVTTADRIFNDFQSLTDGITADKYLQDPAKYSGAYTEAENALKELYTATATPTETIEKAFSKLEYMYTSRTRPILEVASLNVKDPDIEFRCSEEDTTAETPANVQQEEQKGKVGGCYGDLPF